MQRRGWPVWTAIFLLLVSTLFLSACATRMASERTPGADAGGSAARATGPLRPSTSQLMEAYGRLPLHFEENRGQTDGTVRYVARTPGGAVYLTRQGFTLDAEGTVVRLSFAGARAGMQVRALEPLPGRVNYYLGPDASQWRTGIPTYGRVRYEAVYPGIDVVVYGNRQRLEYDFVVAPGADPRRIRVRVDGADALAVDRAGDLTIRHGGRTIVQHAPVVYQERDGRRELIKGRYVLRGRDVTFALGAYDRTRALVIDPVIAYAAKIGPATAKGIAVDAEGNVIVVGESSGSAGYPLVNPAFGPSHCCFPDMIVTKLGPNADTLVYSTFIGGTTSQEVAHGVAVDSAGNAWIIGKSNGWPTTPDAVVPNAQAGFDSTAGVAAKFSPTGSLLYSTYLAGTATGSDSLPSGACKHGAAHGIAIDASDHVYVVGSTSTTDFPTTPGAYQTGRADGPNAQYCHGTGNAAFATKLTAAGALVYSTYLDTAGASDFAYDVVVDALGNAYIGAMGTGAPPVPITTNLTENGATTGGYILKLDASGLPAWATMIGVNPIRVALGPDGSVHFVSTTFPNFFQNPPPQGAPDPVVARLAPDGASYLWITEFAGSGTDMLLDIAVDPDGAAWLTGSSSSPDFPLVGSTRTKQAEKEIVVVKLSATGDLLFSTFLGTFQGAGVTTDAAGNVYLTGNGGDDFTTTPGTSPGSGGLFVMKYFADGEAPSGPQDIVWTSPVKVAVSGSTITKNAGCNGCGDAGAVSQQTIASGNGFVEFKVSSGFTGTVGLGNGNPGTSGSEIKFGLRFFPSYVEVRESGVWKASWPITAGALHRVAVDGGAVKYFLNGTLKHTSTVAPVFPLVVDASINNVGGAVQNAVIGGGSGGGSGSPDTTAPTVAITSPANGATVSGVVTITATASDNVGVTSVIFKDGTQVIGQATTPPYTVEWSTSGGPFGSHTLTAVAKDAAGNTTTSAPVTVTTKDGTPPNVEIFDPVNGATKTGTITIRATAFDNQSGIAGVQFKVDGVNVGAEVTTTPYAIAWDTSTVPNGSHTLTAVARDNGGNTTTSAPVTITTTNDTPSGGPGGPVVWVNPVKVAVSGNTITKNAGCNGCWDAGAASQQSIMSGTPSLSFTVPAGASLTAGLSSGNAGTSANEINHGLKFVPAATPYVEVREKGVWKASWPAVAGAVHKVAVETGGVVKYYQNGTLKYTSTVTPVWPINVDATIEKVGSAVQNAVLGP